MAKKKLEESSKGGPKDNFWKISTKIEGTLICVSSLQTNDRHLAIKLF
jgi:hypothetical protein